MHFSASTFILISNTCFAKIIIIKVILTRTKTSIRYAKENDREKREKKKGRRRYIEREGEIRERGERDRGGERVKGRVKSS